MNSTIDVNHSLLDVSHKLFELHKIKISRAALKEQLLSHPNYPNILSLVDVLQHFNVPSKAIKLGFNQLHKIEPCFFAQVLTEGLVLVSKLHVDSIEYYSGKSGRVTESLEAFNNKWNGIIVLLDVSEALERNNHRQIDGSKAFKITRLVLLLVTVLTLLALLVMAMGLHNLSLLFIIKVSGSILSLMIAGILLQKDSALAEFCHIGEKLNCSTVLHSKASRIFGVMAVADLGVAYFIGGSLTIVAGFLMNLGFEIIPLLAILSFCALPFTLALVYKQAFIIKKWCALCLGVSTLLWLEGWVFIDYYGTKPVSFPEVTAILISCLVFLFVLNSWKYLKEAAEKFYELKDLKYSLVRIKNKESVFKLLQSEQAGFFSAEQVNHITIGNPDARHKVLFVFSLLCPLCAAEFKSIKGLLKEKADDFLMTFIFVGNSSHEKDETNTVQRILIDIYFNSGSDALLLALSEWFEMKHIGKFKERYPLKVSDKALKVLDEHTAWAFQQNIQETPFIIYNNKKLPAYYSPGDLVALKG